MQLVRIQLVLERGAGELDVSIDLGAGKKHLAFEHGAVQQEQIALGMQTDGFEAALHQRAFQVDQTVCPRADQIDPPFDPAVEDRERSNELRIFEIDIIDDPGAYTKPWVSNRLATLETGIEMSEYVCNENNSDVLHLVGK